MLRGGASVGGEQSVHVILSEHVTTGDGLVTALAIGRAIRASLDQLVALRKASGADATRGHGLRRDQMEAHQGSQVAPAPICLPPA